MAGVICPVLLQRCRLGAHVVRREPTTPPRPKNTVLMSKRSVVSWRHKSRGDPKSRNRFQCGHAVVREGAQRPGIKVYIGIMREQKRWAKIINETWKQNNRKNKNHKCAAAAAEMKHKVHNRQLKKLSENCGCSKPSRVGHQPK